MSFARTDIGGGPQASGGERSPTPGCSPPPPPPPPPPRPGRPCFPPRNAPSCGLEVDRRRCASATVARCIACVCACSAICGCSARVIGAVAISFEALSSPRPPPPPPPPPPLIGSPGFQKPYLWKPCQKREEIGGTARSASGARRTHGKPPVSEATASSRTITPDSNRAATRRVCDLQEAQ